MESPNVPRSSKSGKEGGDGLAVEWIWERRQFGVTLRILATENHLKEWRKGRFLRNGNKFGTFYIQRGIAHWELIFGWSSEVQAPKEMQAWRSPGCAHSRSRGQHDISQESSYRTKKTKTRPSRIPTFKDS